MPTSEGLASKVAKLWIPNDDETAEKLANLITEIAILPAVEAATASLESQLYEAWGAVHMIQDIQNLLDAYHAWLKDKTALRQIDQWVEITTPYLDRHNDYVQIYAKRANGGFLLTDDGHTIEDLEQSGCKLDSRKRQDLLKLTLNGFGVQTGGKALQVHASTENFALRKHNLVQAMLAVNDMFYLFVPMVASLYKGTPPVGIDFET